jgi:RNA-binding protein
MTDTRRKVRPQIELPEVSRLAEQSATLSRGALVSAASPRLRGKSRRHLRSLGNTLRPVVHIGHHGLTEGLADAVWDALQQHELVKIKVLETCPESIGTVALWLHLVTGSQVPQWLGRTLLVYRPFDEKPQIRLPEA